MSLASWLTLRSSWFWRFYSNRFQSLLWLTTAVRVDSICSMMELMLSGIPQQQCIMVVSVRDTLARPVRLLGAKEALASLPLSPTPIGNLPDCTGERMAEDGQYIP